MSLVLFLPWPPSVNTYWRHARIRVGRQFVTRVLISEAGRKYRVAVRAAVLEQLKRLPKPITGPVEVSLYLAPPDRRRRDLDNVLKAPLDACTHAGLWKDDSQVKRLMVEWYEYSHGFPQTVAWHMYAREQFPGIEGTVAIAITPIDKST